MASSKLFELKPPPGFGTNLENKIIDKIMKQKFSRDKTLMKDTRSSYKQAIPRFGGPLAPDRPSKEAGDVTTGGVPAAEAG